VGPLRARILARAAGHIQDVVIAGHGRAFAAALVFPNVARCRALCPGLAPDVPSREVLRDARVRETFRTLFADLASEGTGSSTVVSRAILLDEPPSLEAREITDKGSLNQRTVLENRAALVNELYEPAPSVRTIAVLEE
jgi:feruloyl-CoA synthase